MKLTKKVLSIALALIMIIGCVAVSVSADYYSDLASDKYDSNIAISYDQYIRDYSYGTGISAHCPQQVTFNKDGWMRIQSQTEVEEAAYLEAKAAGDTAAMEANEGTYEHQWQLLFKPTAEYQKQFKNAMYNAYQNHNVIFAFYSYVASAKLVNPNDNTYNTAPTVDVAYDITIKADTDYDGEYDQNVMISKIKNETSAHNQYNYQYKEDVIDISSVIELIEMECDFELSSVCIYPQNYAFDKGLKNNKGQEGMALLDIYISPFFMEALPGFNSYKIGATDAFNAADELDPSTFTIGDTTGKIVPEDWQWAGWVQTENEDNEPVFGELGDLLRDENGCPIMENGESYIPVPIVKIGSEEEVVCSNLKATVSGSSVTLTWDYTGHPTNFVIYEASGKYYNDSVDTNSITLTDLEPGTYNFSVAGINAEGTEGVESNEVEVIVEADSPVESTTAEPTEVPTEVPTEIPTSVGPTQPEEPTSSSDVAEPTSADSTTVEEPTEVPTSVGPTQPEEPTSSSNVAEPTSADSTTVEPTSASEEPTSEVPTQTTTTKPTTPIGPTKPSNTNVNPTVSSNKTATTAAITTKPTTTVNINTAAIKAFKFKVVKGKKQLKIKYTKVEGVSGFQVRYKIKGKWKVKTFKVNKSAIKTIKKLKKGTYKIQLRLYKTSGKTKVFGKWGKTNKVKVK